MNYFTEEKPDYEYIEGDESTWKRFTPPAKPDYVDAELVRIAGLNRHNQPNLRCVWAADVVSDRDAERKQLKYSCGFGSTKVNGYKYLENGEWKFTEDLENAPKDSLVLPDVKQEELGLPRWMIEHWVSPEELERQGRFKTLYAEGEITQTLRDFPREGIYDAYFLVENLQGMFRQMDRDVIEFIRRKWNYDQKPFEERERDKQLAEEREELRKEKHNEEIWRAARNFDLRLPKDEKERRDHYWSTIHDYQSEIQRLKQTSIFYQTV